MTLFPVHEQSDTFWLLFFSLFSEEAVCAVVLVGGGKIAKKRKEK